MNAYKVGHEVREGALVPAARMERFKGITAKFAGEWLQLKRKSATKTQSQVAALVGIDPQYLSDFERGRVDWRRSDYRTMLISKLGISPSELEEVGIEPEPRRNLPRSFPYPEGLTTPIYSSLFDALASKSQVIHPVGIRKKGLGAKQIVAILAQTDALEVSNAMGHAADYARLDARAVIDLDVPEHEANNPAYVDFKNQSAFIAAKPIEGRSLILRPFGASPVFTSNANQWHYVGDVVAFDMGRE
jgi:transcriptional regulator with XRE-family HTH domain